MPYGHLLPNLDAALADARGAMFDATAAQANPAANMRALRSVGGDAIGAVGHGPRDVHTSR